MAIYMSERRLSIIAPSVYCDSCGATLDLVGELVSAKLEKAPEDHQKRGIDPVFVIPGIPRDEHAAAQAAIERGWSQETIHGKTLNFCPACKSK